MEESLMYLSIFSDGKLNLSEVYGLSFRQRDMYVKMFNKFIEEKNKHKSLSI